MENETKIMEGQGKLFWIVGVLSFLWYSFGAVQFFTGLTMTDASLKAYVDDGIMTQDYADFMSAFPGWVMAVFGIATIGGLLASLTLLLRKKIAAPLFIISLVAACLMYLYMFGLSGKISVLPAFDYIIAAGVLVVTSLMIWWSRKKVADGTLT